MSREKWQRRHYETVAAGLCTERAGSSKIDQWIAKFRADNPRFRADLFRAAAMCGGRAPRSHAKRPFKVPSLSFGSAGSTHIMKSVRSGRMASKIARQSISASRNGRCGDALYTLTRAFHVQGVGWGHFTSIGRAGNKFVGRKSSKGFRVGRISSKVAGSTMAAYNAFVKACVR